MNYFLESFLTIFIPQNIHTGDREHKYEGGHTDLITECRMSPDDKTFITSSWDKKLRVWDVETGKLLVGHQNMIDFH